MGSSLILLVSHAPCQTHQQILSTPLWKCTPVPLLPLWSKTPFSLTTSPEPYKTLPSDLIHLIFPCNFIPVPQTSGEVLSLWPSFYQSLQSLVSTSSFSVFIFPHLSVLFSTSYFLIFLPWSSGLSSPLPFFLCSS